MGINNFNVQMTKFFISCWLLMSIPFQNALFSCLIHNAIFKNCQFGVFVLHKSINWIVSFSGHLEQDFMFILVYFLFPSLPHFMRVNTFVFIVPGHLKICRILQCLKTFPHWTPLLFYWVSNFVLQLIFICPLCPKE